MKAKKQRTPSEAEKKAWAKRGGMTRKEFNASKRKPKADAARAGDFEVQAFFEGTLAPQSAPFPNEAAATARLLKLAGNPSLVWAKVIENKVVYKDGKAVDLRPTAVYSYHKTGQQFANSKVETLYRKKGGTGILTVKALRQAGVDPALGLMSGDIEIYRQHYYGGEPWWDTARERRA